MWTDPIVEEIRRRREAYAAKINYGIEAICEDMTPQQQESGRGVLALMPECGTASYRWVYLEDGGENYEHYSQAGN